MKQRVVCRRCGIENEVEGPVLGGLHKCSNCENIKFDREFFIPIEKQITENFRDARSSKFGTILKGLYLFGSYARKEPKCGDIDILVTYSEPKLEKFIPLEIETFQDQFLFFSPENYSLIELESILKESFWDFRTCQEYPDCLDCYKDSGNFRCRLPAKDYNSDFHTYCFERCRNRNRNPIPFCCFQYCTFLEMEIRGQILKEVNDSLKKENIEFCEVNPNRKIKVLDLIMKSSMKKLEEEFQFEERRENFQLYRINPTDRRKTLVRKKRIS